MKLRVLDWLVCPVCAGELALKGAEGLIDAAKDASPQPGLCHHCHAPDGKSLHKLGDPCAWCNAIDIDSGTLVCDSGHCFPIREGVPRLRIQDKLDSAPLSQIHGDALNIGDSFGREWAHFDHERDTTWLQDVPARCELFLREVGVKVSELKGKVVLDAGCGNGSLSNGISERFGCEVLAADVSESAVVAHRHFSARNGGRGHFIQADLMNPPFRPDTFDVIFSSGVLHHNPDTRQALRAIAQSLAPAGRIYIWVYEPMPGIGHKLRNTLRRLLAPMPAAIKHAIVAVWLPQSMLRQYLRRLRGSTSPGDQLKWRERFILLLDHYTPRYRWEHTPDQVHAWYRELGYEQIETTERRDYGFGVAAQRPLEVPAVREKSATFEPLPADM